MLTHSFIVNAAFAGLLAGISCGITGVFLVTTHLSFLGVCMAHAAFAGALFGLWLGVDPVLSAAVLSTLTALLIGPLADKGELSPDASAGILFSLMLGLAFLFMGLLPGSRAEALSLFWGGILTVRQNDLFILACVTILTMILVFLFYKEILAVLCHRKVAAAVGIPATFVFYMLLVWCAITLAVSLRIAGGLLVYSLVVNPAAAAYQLTYRLKYIFIVSALLGVSSCWAGLAMSFYWDFPAGASIVIVSCVLFALTLLIRHKTAAYRLGLSRKNHV